MGVGDVRKTPQGQWIVEAPERCARGHSLGPRQVIVSSSQEGGIRWKCVRCGDITSEGARNRQ